MKTSLLASALLFASVSLFGAVAGGGVPPTTTTPTVPTVKPGCTTPAAPKAPEKKEAQKKCDDAKRPFKK